MHFCKKDVGVTSYTYALSRYIPIDVIMLPVLIKTRTHLKVWIRLLVLLVLESVVVDVSDQSLCKIYFKNTVSKNMFICQSAYRD
jgi:hypothetical protein